MLGTYPATGDSPAKEPVTVMVFDFLSNDNLSYRHLKDMLTCSCSIVLAPCGTSVFSTIIGENIY